jgi:hypothetical protein
MMLPWYINQEFIGVHHLYLIQAVYSIELTIYLES